MKVVSKTKTTAIAVHDGHPFLFSLDMLDNPETESIGTYIDDCHTAQPVTKTSLYGKLFMELWEP
jgi:hypothetical protein